MVEITFVFCFKKYKSNNYNFPLWKQLSVTCHIFIGRLRKKMKYTLKEGYISKTQESQLPLKTQLAYLRINIFTISESISILFSISWWETVISFR